MERRLIAIEALADALRSGRPAAAALKEAASAVPELATGAAVALSEGGLVDALESLREFLGPDLDWIRLLTSRVDSREAGELLRDAASVARTFHQLMEERRSILAWQRRLARLLVSVLGASASILGGVASLLWRFAASPFDPSPALAVVGGSFALLILAEVGDSPCWVLAYILAYLAGRLILLAFGVVV